MGTVPRSRQVPELPQFVKGVPRLLKDRQTLNKLMDSEDPPSTLSDKVKSSSPNTVLVIPPGEVSAQLSIKKGIRSSGFCFLTLG